MNESSGVLFVDGTILRQVIQSGYLDYREMGRFLLFVSKSITELSYLCNDIWKSLLVDRFGVEISYEMMNKLHCGPQKCFCHLTKTEPLKSQKIDFTPSDYRIIINVYDDVGKRIIFKIVCGEEIVRLAVSGCSGIDDCAEGNHNHNESAELDAPLTPRRKRGLHRKRFSV